MATIKRLFSILSLIPGCESLFDGILNGHLQRIFGDNRSKFSQIDFVAISITWSLMLIYNGYADFLCQYTEFYGILNNETFINEEKKEALGKHLISMHAYISISMVWIFNNLFRTHS